MENQHAGNNMRVPLMQNRMITGLVYGEKQNTLFTVVVQIKPIVQFVDEEAGRRWWDLCLGG